MGPGASRGVSVASATLTWHVRAHTLVQLLGDTGALTLHAAAHLHGVETRQPPIITGAVTGRTVKRVTGTRVATRKKLEVVTRDNLPVTTAASTVLDLTDIPGTTWREGVHTVARWIHRTPSPLRSCPQHSRHAPATSTVPSSAPPCPRSSREQRASSRCRPSTA